MQKNREVAKESANMFQDVTLCFQVSSWVLWKIPPEILLCAYIYIHTHSVFAYTFACACTLFSDHPAPAHSNTVMLLILLLHFLPIIGLFQGTNPASCLSQSSLLANALCGQPVSCSSPLASEKQPSLQPTAGCSSFEVLLARLRSTRLAQPSLSQRRP